MYHPLAYPILLRGDAGMATPAVEAKLEAEGIRLPDTNTCSPLLRQKQPHLVARRRSAKITDITLCSIVVYKLRHGAESSSEPSREHAKLDVCLALFSSLPFDDASAARCAEVRRALDSPPLPFNTTSHW